MLYRTEQPCTPTVDNEEETINEKRLIAENKNVTKTPQAARPRSLQREVQEAGKQVKEAAGLLQQSIKKRDCQASQDDCDIYALGLAKKLRAFSEEERLEIMYDLDGMILNRHRAKHPNRFTSTTFIAPSQYSRCSSPMSSCSEPLSREVLYSQNTLMGYSEPAQVHVPQEQDTRQIYSKASEISQSQYTDAETGSNININSNQAVGGDHLSDIIAQAYNTA
ncbi:unnamed protein product [Acanthoscelides obtectus]|uniref:Uncharacterized protein n=1 Tax=Acanthoscelides obtectus TaxID=200917 RepID=A0A9P0LUX6_ACAOB|nr:unnamed protein product [Acanthoscelides obtectus]CAK1680578.1 hypothetical protein AOBTE_LOCUS32775 [Acanthoscelides obtectus]